MLALHQKEAGRLVQQHKADPRTSTFTTKDDAMADNSSASTREHTPHVNQTTRTATIIDALKRRAQSVLNDRSIEPQSRAIIRYALEINDPWLAELVRRAEAGESIETIDFSQTPEGGSTEED